MGKKKKVLVACGTAIATSTVVARKIQEKLSERGIDVIIDQCKATEVQSKLSGVDLIVTTTQITEPENIPVIRTISFLTGMGIDEDMNKIVAILEG
jgi:PTS system galactitol-specific IIB component